MLVNSLSELFLYPSPIMQSLHLPRIDHTPPELTAHNLLVILRELLPPAYPLPEEILAQSLRFRHQYFPPPSTAFQDDARATDGLLPESSSSYDAAGGVPVSSSSSSGSGGPDLWIAQRDSGSTVTIQLQRLAHALELHRGIDLHEVPHGEAALEWVQELLGNGSPVKNSEEQEGDVVGYEQKDEETFTCRLRLPVADGADANQDGQAVTSTVEIRLLYSPPSSQDTPAGASDGSALAWKLLDTMIVPSVELAPTTPFSQQASWLQTPIQARNHYLSRVARSEGQARTRNVVFGEHDEQHELDDGGAGTAGDDFWGGYGTDDEDKHVKSEVAAIAVEPHTAVGNVAQAQVKAGTAESTPQAIHQARFPGAVSSALDAEPSAAAGGGGSNRHLHRPTPPPTSTPGLSRFATPDDSYWASYAGVEDGLRASNPPSPRGGRSVASTPGLGRGAGSGTAGASGTAPDGYWGTGGETPVSWSPPPARGGGQPLPSFSRRVSQASLDAEPKGGEARDAPLNSHWQSQSSAAADGLGIHQGSAGSSAAKTASSAVVASTNSGASHSTGRQALEATLRGVRDLFMAQAGLGEQDRAEAEREFKEALKAMI